MPSDDERSLPPVRVPLTLMQQEMWDWLERWPRSQELFNDTIRITFPGPFDADVVRRVVEFLVARHEPLRTTLHRDENGTTYQSIAPQLDLDLKVVDLTALPPGEREVELERLVAAQHAEPIDITAGPLFHASVIRTGDAEAVLALTLEHIISDQTTDSILYAELQDVYTALAQGREPTLPSLPIQYADFAIWQAQWLTEERLRAGVLYWRNQLRGMPLDVALPCDRTREPDGDKRTACVDFFIRPEVQAALERLARDTRSTLFIVSVAAVQSLLFQYTEEPDVALLTTFHGRDRPELEGLVGMFAGVALLRGDLSGDPSFEDVIEGAKAAVLGMIEHHYVPFDMVVEALVADLRAQGVEETPQAPVSVEFFHAAEGPLRSGMSLVVRRPERERHLSADSTDVHDTLNPLAFRIFGGAEMWGRVSYHEAVFDRGTIERLVCELKALLSAVALDPGARLSSLPPVDRRVRTAS